MSYDLRIGVKVEGTDIIAVIAEPDYSSPTYNIGDMLRAAMDWDFEQGQWYNVAEVYPKIVRGYQELSDNEKSYRKYNAKNGWGNTETACNTLKSLLECIAEQTGDSYWGTWQVIPAEHLWLRW
jgi:hypothetical protein